MSVGISDWPVYYNSIIISWNDGFNFGVPPQDFTHQCVPIWPSPWKMSGHCHDFVEVDKRRSFIMILSTDLSCICPPGEEVRCSSVCEASMRRWQTTSQFSTMVVSPAPLAAFLCEHQMCTSRKFTAVPYPLLYGQNFICLWHVSEFNGSNKVRLKCRI